MKDHLDPIHRNTLGDLLSKNAAKFSNKTAITFYREGSFEPESLTYAELNAAANRFANGLTSLGLKPGDVAAVMSHNCLQFVIAIWGFLKANLITTFINVNLMDHEIAYQINHSDAKILFVEDPFIDTVLSVKAEIANIEHFGIINTSPGSVPKGWLDIDDFYSEKFPDTEPDVAIRGEDVAFRLYTSGTTAFPKGIDLTFANADCIVHSFAGNNGIGQVIDSTFGYFIPLYHGGMFHMLCSISLGSHIVLGSISDIEGTMKIIQKEKIDITGFPVTIFSRMLDYPGLQHQLRSLKMIWWFGGAMPLDVMKQWLELFPSLNIAVLWSQTECLVGTIAWFNNQTGLPDAGNVIGAPILDTVMKLVDKDDNEVDDRPGEIVMRSPSVMKEYFKNKDATAEVFRNGWHHTGDVAVKGEDGYFYFVDRVKDMIKTGGVNVSSMEVEAVLNRMEGVKTSGVFGIPHPDWTEAVVAAVVKKDHSLTEGDIIQFCKENIARFKVPKKVVFVSEIPINHVGKILRKKLRETYNDLFLG